MFSPGSGILATPKPWPCVDEFSFVSTGIGSVSTEGQPQFSSCGKVFRKSKLGNFNRLVQSLQLTRFIVGWSRRLLFGKAPEDQHFEESHLHQRRRIVWWPEQMNRCLRFC